jgi:cytochrome P450
MKEQKTIDRTTIFHQLLQSETVKNGIVPTVQELEDEAYDILAAASETTGNALTVAAYHVVRNPQIYITLLKELRTAFPDENRAMDCNSLKALPYLVSHPSEYPTKIHILTDS